MRAQSRTDYILGEIAKFEAVGSVTVGLEQRTHRIDQISGPDFSQKNGLSRPARPTHVLLHSLERRRCKTKSVHTIERTCVCKKCNLPHVVGCQAREQRGNNGHHKTVLLGFEE